MLIKSMYRDTMLLVRDCPFCGSEAKFRNIGNRLSKKRVVEISCSGVCSITMKTAAIHRDMDWLEDVSVANWNKRFKNKDKE